MTIDPRREFLWLLCAFVLPSIFDAIYALLSRGLGIQYALFAAPQLIIYCGAGAYLTIKLRAWLIAVILILVASIGDITLGNLVGSMFGVEQLPKDPFSLVLFACISLLVTCFAGLVGVSGASITRWVFRKRSV